MRKIFTNGCFDVLHRGHLELLQYAKSLGDILIVGVDSDEKITLDKGPPRPHNKLEDRVKMLKSLRCIDEVHTFNDTVGLEKPAVTRPDLSVPGHPLPRRLAFVR